jgi:hypothetical protein
MNITNFNRIVYLITNENVKITANDTGKEIPIYQSIGNTSGLHSFARELMIEKYVKSGERSIKKLLKCMESGKSINIYYYRNTTRDRGAWKLSKTL